MDNETKWAALFTVALLVGAVVMLWFKAGVEADTYNRLTGSDLTQWEALWVNTRIDCSETTGR